MTVREPRVLRHASSVMIHLASAPVVARVTGITAVVRSGDAWFAREVAVAAHLVAAGAPAVAPQRRARPGPP